MPNTYCFVWQDTVSNLQKKDLSLNTTSMQEFCTEAAFYGQLCLYKFDK